MTAPQRTHPAIEPVIVVVVFVASSLWGVHYCRQLNASGRHAFYYQSTYEPAVRLACGRGFTVAAVTPPALQAFLNETTDTFSCDQLPPGETTSHDSVQPQITARLYLMSTVALAWRIGGISWSGLAPLFGVLFGVTTVCAYALFRLGAGRVVASAATAAFALSPLQLAALPALLDYVTAPFMLAALFAIGALVALRDSTPRPLSLSMAYGALLGLSFGFRPDVIVTVPLYLLALVAFSDRGALANLPRKAIAATLAAATCLLVAWPLLRQKAPAGSCTPHVVVLGLMTNYTDALGLEPAAYDWGHLAQDEFAYETTTSFAHRASRGMAPIAYCSPEYDRAGEAFLLTVGRTFPADVVTRTYASVLKTLELPFGWPRAPLPDLLPGVYRVRSAIVAPLRATGLFWVAAAILVAAWFELRQAVFLLVTASFLGGFPVLQFAARHHFFLEVVTLWAMAYLVSNVRPLWRERPGTIGAPRRITRVVAFVAVSVLLLIAPLVALRKLQQRSVTSLLRTYLDLPAEPLRSDALPLKNPIVPGAGGPAMLVDVAMNMATCPDAATVTFQYATSPDVRYFTRTYQVKPTPGIHERTHVIAPVYRGFESVAVIPDGCLAGVYRVAAEHQPLWVFAVLPPLWHRLPLYQRLGHIVAPYSTD